MIRTLAAGLHLCPLKRRGTHVRKSLSLILLLGLPAFAQITGGTETVQDAIRFQREKDAADARQARIEARRAAGSSADREEESGQVVKKIQKTKKGSATRSTTTTSKPAK
jgi:hypothetical protein